ncbi:MAG: CRISPR-associated protein Csd1 family, partial [Verrucomicrobiaceae bacterium]|nr:CRISPR-associated protein Csd1 family [Verrucomicrobiaceae bacterium]
FLWDNSGYMLGYKPEDEKPGRTAEACAEFRKKHLELEKELSLPEFSAVCRLLETWNPSQAAEYKTKLDDFAATGFGVFQIQGQAGYVHELPAIKKWWDAQQAQDEAGLVGQCLVTGEAAPIAEIHKPAIKGVRDSQSSGALLVSFNIKSSESYGDEQGHNAQVSQKAVFNYANALNTMLGGPLSHRHRVQIGDATTVFWTEKPTEVESLFADFVQGYAVEEKAPNQDQALATRIHIFMEILRQGGGAELGKLGDDPQTKFFVLGLSPNAARLSVRFWHVSTLGQMVDKLKSHYDALRLRGSPDRDPEFPAAWQLLRQTGRESKDIPPILAGPLLHSILSGCRYPQGLFSAVLNRIRADHEVTYLRACIFKAFLTRNHQLDIPMSLDATRTEPAYLLGRLFAVLEKTQEDALPGINATIRDRFYSAASATPGSVFPRLLRTYQHHLSKAPSLWVEMFGPKQAHSMKVGRENLIQEIMGKLSGMPAHLVLEGQGLFAIGYYHQRQDFFTKKDKPESAQN